MDDRGDRRARHVEDRRQEAVERGINRVDAPLPRHVRVVVDDDDSNAHLELLAGLALADDGLRRALAAPEANERPPPPTTESVPKGRHRPADCPHVRVSEDKRLDPSSSG